MPIWAKRKIAARGGAIRWRTKKIDGYLRIAVTRKKGPRGGRTVAYKVPKSEVGRHKRKRRRRSRR